MMTSQGRNSSMTSVGIRSNKPLNENIRGRHRGRGMAATKASRVPTTVQVPYQAPQRPQAYTNPTYQQHAPSSGMVPGGVPKGMRPPSSHPSGGFNGQMNQQQMMARQQQMMARQQGQNWQGPNGQMVPQPNQGALQQNMGIPRQGAMPPPSAPAANANTNGRTQPSSRQQASTAPSTPSQTNKASPKKKGEINSQRQDQAQGNSQQRNPQYQMQMQMQLAKQQTQQDPSEENGQQRAQSPGSAERAPSPSKRPRLDGPFNQQQTPNGRRQSEGIVQNVVKPGPRITKRKKPGNDQPTPSTNNPVVQFRQGYLEPLGKKVSYTISEDLSGDRRNQIMSRISKKRCSGLESGGGVLMAKGSPAKSWNLQPVAKSGSYEGKPI